MQYNHVKYMGYRAGPMRSSSQSRTCSSQIVIPLNY